jgi:signal transduction histidine kinase/ActR/RegA family two-component response regulator
MFWRFFLWCFLLSTQAAAYSSSFHDLTSQGIQQPEGNPVTKGEYTLALSRVSQVLLDQGGVMSLDQIIKSKNFENTREGKVTSYSADKVYWYRFLLKNTEADDVNLILKTNHRTVIDAALYQVDRKLADEVLSRSESQVMAPDKLIRYHTFGDYQVFNERAIQSKKYSLPIHIAGGSEQYVYLRWVNEGKATYNMQLVDEAAFLSQQMMEQAFLFLMLGFSLAVLIYCMLIFLKTKEKMYLSYALYVVAFVVFLEVHAGGAAVFWPEVVPSDMYGRFLWTSAFLIYFSFARFTSDFLLLEEKAPEFNVWLNYFQWFSFLFAASSFFIPYNVVEMSTYLMAMLIIPFALYSAIFIFRKFKDSAAKIYLISFLPLCIYILFLVITYAFGQYEFPYILEGIRAAFGLNLLLLSAALTNQFNVMSEKQQAYENKLIAVAASEAAKNDFFAKMSHEIRTPLNGVLGVSQLLQDTCLTEQQKKYVEILNASSKALMHFVDNALDYSKIEAGKMPLEKVSFDLENLLLDIESVFILKTFESQVPLLFEVQESLPKFWLGDANRIRQILINLIANAYKFTNEGVIKIRIFRDLASEISQANRQWVHFEVIDTGIGIPPAQIESIFEDFTQVYSANNRRYGGAGLGLAICRELSKLLDGEIGLESQMGKGSRFWVKLPLDAVEVESVEVENVEIGEGFDKKSGYRRSRAFHLLQNDFLVSKTLLFIDSCEAYREQVQAVARTWGLKAGVAASLPEALAKIRTANDVEVEIDLVVLDYRCLQNDEGSNHFLAALDRHQATKNSSIVILTSQASIAARFNVPRSNSIFISQRPAFVYKLENVFVAAIKKDEDFFAHNRPLFDAQLNEAVVEAAGKDI